MSRMRFILSVLVILVIQQWVYGAPGGALRGSTPTNTSAKEPVFCQTLATTPTIDQCLSSSWANDFFTRVPKVCESIRSAVVNNCMKLLNDPVNRQKVLDVACAPPKCPAYAEASPNLECYPKYVINPIRIAADGSIYGNRIGWDMHVEQKSFPDTWSTGMPSVEDAMLEALLINTTPAYRKSQIGTSNYDESTTIVDTQTNFGSGNSTNFFMGAGSMTLGANLVCPQSSMVHAITRHSYDYTDRFKNPLLADSLVSCKNYAQQKYYDLAVFKSRLQSNVPSILKVKSAYWPVDSDPHTNRGNIGYRVINSQPLSDALFGGQNHRQYVNPNFILTKGKTRPASLLDEVLKKLRANAALHLPNTKLDDLLQPKVNIKSDVVENWRWHYEKQRSYPLVAEDEDIWRAKRKQLLDILTRRAQLEYVTNSPRIALNAIATPPTHIILKAGYINALARGELRVSLASISEDEKKFMQSRFLADFDRIKSIYENLDPVAVQKHLSTLDSFFAKHLDVNYSACKTFSRPSACEWLPEMFTEHFRGIEDKDLVGFDNASPNSLVAAEDFCIQSTKHLSCLQDLRNYEMTCMISDTIHSKNGSEITKWDACGCKQTIFGSYRCAPYGELNSKTLDSAPVYYATENYNATIDALEVFFERQKIVEEKSVGVMMAFVTYDQNNKAEIGEIYAAEPLEIGNDLIGVEINRTFTWTQQVFNERAYANSNMNIKAKVLGFSADVLSLTVNSDNLDASSQSDSVPQGELIIAGQEFSFEHHIHEGESFTPLEGKYYFQIGPVPCSVAFGVTGEWNLDIDLKATSTNVDVDARFGAGANVFLEGGVDVGFASAGLGANLEVFHIEPHFDAHLSLASTLDLDDLDNYRGNANLLIQLKTKLDLETRALGGRIYGWAKVGVGALSKKFTLTIWDWEGLKFNTTLWDRTLEIANLDTMKVFQQAVKNDNSKAN